MISIPCFNSPIFIDKINPFFSFHFLFDLFVFFLFFILIELHFQYMIVFFHLILSKFHIHYDFNFFIFINFINSIFNEFFQIFLLKLLRWQMCLTKIDWLLHWFKIVTVVDFFLMFQLILQIKWMMKTGAIRNVIVCSCQLFSSWIVA